MNLSKGFATCPKNLEPLLAMELKELGLINVSEKKAGVQFEGDTEAFYRACIGSRIANHVLWAIRSFELFTLEDLYREVSRIQWQLHMDDFQTFAIRVTQIASPITHTQYAAQKMKDAIVDQWRQKTGHRPSVDLDQPDIQFHLHVEYNHATIYVDLTGESLHRRGYRKQQGEAPLKENLAAAIVLRSGFKKIAEQGGDFIDPLCGSGTLLIEAALIAMNYAPGLLREYYAVKGWRQFRPAIWEKVIQTAKQAIKTDIPNHFYGVDHDADIVQKAQQNIQRAGLSDKIQVKKADMLSVEPTTNTGVVVCNPPYGERLGQSLELYALYEALGKHLKTHFSHWRFTLFTGNPELSRAVPLSARKKYKMFNGDIPCELLNYDILTRAAE